ncbi:HlyD family efflux transporter periplasmic adaptor subunit [Pedobacter sp. MC2016-15]|uniref:HlyD family secretion protein n=1 Tax=Pedobacter sp. MC2016-15 TaxID=2994473 RepID=UPI002247131C|nr:HlyD family efflux transporter periplasmic adaptor subunit [Pedobacter sp. MC2016-15]MCX2478708.1 HlyD family efflux transporter periplasmic adaptor subunit [Pedobacter sp. MC2016-15]
MNQDQYIFPQEIVENTAEFHFHTHRSATTVIYQVMLLVLFSVLLGMFFIKVDVNVKSMGLFRPVSERNDIKSLVSGRIDSVLVTENTHVKSGQILFTLKRESLEGKNDMTSLQRNDIRAQLNDLEALISAAKSNSWPQRINLQSGLYGQQYSYFMQRMEEARSRYRVAQRNFDRYLYLFQRRAISSLEYEDAKLKVDNIHNELSLIGEDQGSKWQTEFNSLKIQQRELNSQSRQYAEEKEFYTLRATVAGSVQQLKGIQPGTLVAANELLGEISPDSGIIAETYVLPRDIGLLKIGTGVKFQVDAYNYNQWGMLQGKVISISNDIFMENGKQPYFKVRCSLNQKQLVLKNGYVGKIRKGMTMQARFFVTRRTLFQLLYDQADDWLNPNVTTNQMTTS